jgi:hypothetical protein
MTYQPGCSGRSVTKIAASTIPEGGSAKEDPSPGRVVGEASLSLSYLFLIGVISRHPLFQPRPCHGAQPCRLIAVYIGSSILQKLVELVPALQTSSETLERARAFAAACGKGTFQPMPAVHKLSCVRGDDVKRRPWIRVQRSSLPLLERG